MLLRCGHKGPIAIFVASFKRWLPSLLIMPGVAIFSLAHERTVVQMEEVRNRNAETERRVEVPGATAGTSRDDQQMGGQQTAGSDATSTHPTNDSASNFLPQPHEAKLNTPRHALLMLSVKATSGGRTAVKGSTMAGWKDPRYLVILPQQGANLHVHAPRLGDRPYHILVPRCPVVLSLCHLSATTHDLE